MKMLQTCINIIETALSHKKVVGDRTIICKPCLKEDFYYPYRSTNSEPLSTVEIKLIDGTAKMDFLIYNYCFLLSKEVPEFQRENPVLPFTMEEYKYFYMFLMLTGSNPGVCYLKILNYMMPVSDDLYKIQLKRKHAEMLYEYFGDTFVLSKTLNFDELTNLVYLKRLRRSPDRYLPEIHPLWKTKELLIIAVNSLRKAFWGRYRFAKTTINSKALEELIPLVIDMGYSFFMTEIPNAISAEGNIIYCPVCMEKEIGKFNSAAWKKP